MFSAFSVAYFQVRTTKSVHILYFLNNFFVICPIAIKFAETIWVSLVILFICMKITLGKERGQNLKKKLICAQNLDRFLSYIFDSFFSYSL